MQIPGGLSALTGMGGIAPPPTPAGPPDAWDHARVQKALDIIEQNPGISAQMMQQIMSEAIGPVQAQIDQRKTRREGLMSDAFGGLTQAALSGATPEMLGGLSSAYQSMAPQLQKPGPSGRLSDVVLSLGPVGAGFSQDPQAQTPQLDSETVAGITADVQAAMTKTGPDGNPLGLHEVRMAIMNSMRAQGFSEDALAKAYNYIGQVWQQNAPPELAPPSGVPYTR